MSAVKTDYTLSVFLSINPVAPELLDPYVQTLIVKSSDVTCNTHMTGLNHVLQNFVYVCVHTHVCVYGCVCVCVCVCV